MVTAVFGFTAMNHFDHDGVALSGCNNFMPNIVTCAGDIFQMVLHHISSFASFSQISINSLTVSVVLSFLVLAGAAALRELLGMPLDFAPTRLFILKFDATGRNSNFRFLNWLSLFENSPSRYA